MSLVNGNRIIVSYSIDYKLSDGETIMTAYHNPKTLMKFKPRKEMTYEEAMKRAQEIPDEISHQFIITEYSQINDIIDGVSYESDTWNLDEWKDPDSVIHQIKGWLHEC